MPFVRIVSNQPALSKDRASALLAEVSQCVSSLLGKPERWVMTCLDPGAAMTFSGTPEPACYVEVKNIGALSGNVTQKISHELCTLLAKHLDVPPNRTYIEFTNAVGHLWGHDSSTFG
ncbi:MAG TPA: phenylpyruvate tautomerase MIF-related protein [Polyangiaceae bacterium]|nr:phenylpyruvate tautomerase MIF-related protein [Polyangiaceae bacterium]